jgi:integrase
MRNRLPPYVELNRVGSRKYYYFRIGKGARIRLPDDIHSEEFRAAYAAAMAGKPDQPKKDAPGTIGALIESYEKSAAFVRLKETSKPGYTNRLMHIRKAHGHRTVAGMTRENIIKFVLEPLAAHPGAAQDTLKKLRILIKHAIDIGWLKHDPSARIKRAKTKEIRAWTNAELDIFRARWPMGTNERAAFAMMLYLGAARVDSHKIAWQDIKDGSYTRSKTGITAYFGDEEELREALQAIPRSHVTVLNSQLGKPYSMSGFSRFMRDTIKAAGLPMDCKPHGLRETLGRLLADNEVSTHDIMARLGHKTLAEAERYTREADRRRGGRRAVVKLAEHLDQSVNKLPQIVSEVLGKSSKTEGTSNG